MSKCKDCTHWSQEHKNEGYMGCRIWNEYKHAGVAPNRSERGFTCMHCGEHNDLAEHGLDGEDYCEKQSKLFEHNLTVDGPSKPSLQVELKQEQKRYTCAVIKLREHKRKIKIIKNILKKKSRRRS